MDAVKTTDYSLVMMDWNMPNMHGLDAVRAIRESGQTMPIIIVTTESEKSRVLESVRAGVNGFITKPFTPDASISKIQSLVTSLNE